MLIRTDTLKPWGGEQVKGASLSLNVEDIWTAAELAEGGLVPCKPFTPPAGQQIVPGSTPTYAADGTETYPVQAAPVVRRRVMKSTIIARLSAAGKLTAAAQALTADPVKLMMWTAADQPAVYADDAATTALLQSVGADPAAVLA
jgi:hypothetical protein